MPMVAQVKDMIVATMEMIDNLWKFGIWLKTISINAKIIKYELFNV